MQTTNVGSWLRTGQMDPIGRTVHAAGRMKDPEDGATVHAAGRILMVGRIVRAVGRTMGPEGGATVHPAGEIQMGGATLVLVENN